VELQGTLSSARLGWKSQPAITRLREALTEIKLVSRIDPILGAEGAVALLERISPALENVDSSSGAIGTAVNHTIAELVPVIVAAPADTSTRAAWLGRLFDAHGADQIPYIERLADHWGELCGTAQVASAWADRLVGVTRLALSPDKTVRGYFRRHVGVPECPVRRWTLRRTHRVGAR